MTKAMHSSRAWASRQSVTFGRPGEDELVSADSRISPSATGCASASVNRSPRPFGIKMFVMFIIIDTNYLMPELSDGDSSWRSPRKKPPT